MLITTLSDILSELRGVYAQLRILHGTRATIVRVELLLLECRLIAH